MIKNKEEFKNYNIVCTNKKEVQKTMDFLKNLNFEVEDMTSIKKDYIIVMFNKQSNKFVYDNWCKLCYKNISFYRFKKLAKKFLKEEEEKLEDFEVASDGRITKVNNWESQKIVYSIPNYSYELCGFSENDRKLIDFGLLYATEESRDKAQFKLEIETKLKNIAERLNDGEKIDWDNVYQYKIYIWYNFSHEKLDYDLSSSSKNQGTILCLSNKFLDEAKKEIGEEDLIKYFRE